MVEFISARMRLSQPACDCDKQHSKPIGVAATAKPSNFGRRNLHWEGSSQGKQAAHYCACDVELYLYTSHVLNNNDKAATTPLANWMLLYDTFHAMSSKAVPATGCAALTSTTTRAIR